MQRKKLALALFPLGLSVIIAACSASDGSPQNGAAPPAETSQPQVATGGAGFINVAESSSISVALRGGLGPLIEGQTVTQAMMTVEDVELVSESGQSVVLMQDPMTIDVLAAQNSLDQLVRAQTIAAGQYTAMRFRLDSAWVQTVDDQNATRVFASQQVDTSQFTDVSSVSTLQLSGFDSGGYVIVGLPSDGIAVQGEANLAMHFDLAESLTVQSAGVWVLNPSVWCVDASTFSSLDVQFSAATQIESFSELASQGFQVMLFDSGYYPICAVPLVESSSSLYVASFDYLESFEGPYTAVLAPPYGYSLANEVAVSVNVEQSVSVQSVIDVSAIDVSRSAGLTTFDVRTAGDARVIASDRSGHVLRRDTRPVGPIDRVGPRGTSPGHPIRPGRERPGPAETPRIPGLPGPNGVVNPRAPRQPAAGARAPRQPGMGAGAEQPGQPGQPGMRGPEQPGMGRPGQPGTRGPEQPGMGRPGQPGMRGPEQPGQPNVSGPQQPPRQPNVSGPQQPPRQPNVSGPQQPPRQPNVSGPQQPPARQPNVSGPQQPPARQPNVSAPQQPPARQPNVSGPQQPPARQPNVSRPQPPSPPPSGGGGGGGGGGQRSRQPSRCTGPGCR